jgi:multidrug resistance efflux pump
MIYVSEIRRGGTNKTEYTSVQLETKVSHNILRNDNMVTVFLLGYIGLVVVAFKVIKIKVTPVACAVAILLGVFLMGGIVITWKFAAPMSDQMTLHRKVTQLLANQDSKEYITKIHVQQEQPVKKGDPLYEVDATPNQYALNKARAQIAVAEQKVLQAQAGIEVAAARVEEAKANQGLSKAQLDTALKTHDLNPGAVAILNVEVAQQTYLASDAGVNNAIANQKVAEFALTTALNSVKADQAALEVAKLNLRQNVTRAPSDGYIMNWQAMEGTMTTTVITSAQGTFMDTSKPGVIAAVFPQNLVKNMAPGNPVDIAFKSLPGQIVTGKVDAVLEYTGEGQLLSIGQLPIAKNLKSKGFLVVRITIDDEALASDLPLGAAGSVAVYTDALKPFHIISKITIRIKMWVNYLPI